MQSQPARPLPPLDPARTRVAVIIPVRNEVRWIEQTLACVLAQTFAAERTEIVVVDGMSDDGTRQILERYADAHERVRILDNLERTIPNGLNRGIDATTAPVVIRVDGRCHVEPDYIERCVDALAASGAGNVGGPVRSRGVGTVGRAIALAMRSRFGVGNSRYHYLEREEYVDTVYMGAFRREVLDELGGYDAELTRNQDDELNYRVRAAGFRILLSPDIRSTYTPPTSLKRLWQSQYFQYGLWKVRVIEKHPESIQARHLAPPVLVLTLVTSVGAALVSRRRRLLFPVALYLAAGGAAAGWTSRPEPRLFPAVLAIFWCMHLGYGSGFLLGLLRSVQRRAAVQSTLD